MIISSSPGRGTEKAAVSNQLSAVSKEQENHSNKFIGLPGQESRLLTADSRLLNGLEEGPVPIEDLDLREAKHGLRHTLVAHGTDHATG